MYKSCILTSEIQENNLSFVSSIVFSNVINNTVLPCSKKFLVKLIKN